MWYFFIFLIFISFSNAQDHDKEFRFGADVFFEKYYHLIENKKIGVICNQASVLKNGVHLVDSLLNRGARINALFSPEHGIRGEFQAGVKISDGIDSVTGLKIFSLYGQSQKPTKQMLDNIDILIFDLQDVGARFYTYTITMFNAMQAAAENEKLFIVLDRPNPINGEDIEGPILDLSLKSNVGIFPIPVRHGLTIGEIAKMIIGERWLGKNLKLHLIVIPMVNWNRKKYFDELGMKWIGPSPNLKNFQSVIIYPGTCFLEATNVSEGRGTDSPFQIFGAPWIDSKLLVSKLNKLNLAGVIFKTIEFVPSEDGKTNYKFKYSNQRCAGILIEVVNRKNFKPVKTGLNIIYQLAKLYPDSVNIDYKFFSKLLGMRVDKNYLTTGKLLNYYEFNEKKWVNLYEKKRKKYLIYQNF